MNALTFNSVSLAPVSGQPGIWITSSDLAKALGYARPGSVNKIYERNADEFPVSMTQNVKLTLLCKNNDLQRDIRIFSLRGCHLVAMFAKTKVAKDFRKWVLDILDQETPRRRLSAPSTVTDRVPLKIAVNKFFQAPLTLPA